MLITKKSIFSGQVNSMDLPITQEQIDKWKNGATIQSVMPHLTSDEREFLLTGMLPDEWSEYFDEIQDEDINGY